jgi:glycine/D-amino acid oxidase-like deaminating enzyme
MSARGVRRRELLAAVFGVPFATQLLACASKPVVRAPIAGGFVEPSMAVGHLLRGAPPSDEQFARAPTKRTRVAILGGGPAGLSSAWALARAGFTDFTLLELEPSVGGTSASGQAKSTAYPWGAHYITTPLAEHTDLITLLRELDALEEQAGEHPVGREALSVREPKERVFYKGFFYPGLYLRVGATPEDLAQLARFEALVERYAGLRDARGRRAFSIPLDESSDDAELTSLDKLSAAEWLRSQGLSSPRLLAYAEHACRDDYGLTLEHTSAWALLFYYAARKDPARDHESEVITWPDGNGTLVAHLAAAAGAAPIRTGKLVVDVLQREREVHVHVLDAVTRAPERLIAERAIVATPRFIAERIVRALRDAPAKHDTFTHGAWLVANLHLRDRPASRGAPPAWDNVLYESPSLGYVTATHQRGRDRGPTVLTYYLPMTDADARAGRKRLLEPSFDEWTEAVCSDLEVAHPDLRQHVQRVELCRFGHGMVQPRVGTVWSPQRRAAATPMGALHFAHSDLSGVALFEEAFHHGVRAAREVMAMLAAP